MAAAKSKKTKVHTPVFRASYASVFSASTFSSDGDSKDKKPQYEVTMVFPPVSKMKPDEKARYDNMVKIANEASMAGFSKPLNKLPANFHQPIRKNEEREGKEGFPPGGTFAKATTFLKPGIVGADGKTPIDDEEGFYSGCYARATVVAAHYDNKSKGVKFYLNNLMFVRDGERLDGRVDAAEDFGEMGEDDVDDLAS